MSEEVGLFGKSRGWGVQLEALRDDLADSGAMGSAVIVLRSALYPHCGALRFRTTKVRPSPFVVVNSIGLGRPGVATQYIRTSSCSEQIPFV